MKYTKIKLEFKYGPKNRFYREVLVKGNPNLLKLGVMLGVVLGAEFEHCFLITCDKDSAEYVMAPFMESPMPGDKYIGNYYFNDLPENFTFEYDTGDGWDFECKKNNEKVEYDSKKDMILLNGAGQSIWEDNIRSLSALFDGEIDPNFDGEDEDKGIYKPWNVSIDKYGDFDLPLDIDDINEHLDNDINSAYRYIRQGEKLYIEEYDVCIDDYIKPNHYQNDYVIRIINEQIEEFDFVKEVFEKLNSKYGEEKAKEEIAKVLISYFDEINSKNKDVDPEEYKKRLFELK